jgi:hypothetical protein
MGSKTVATRERVSTDEDRHVTSTWRSAVSACAASCRERVREYGARAAKRAAGLAGCCLLFAVVLCTPVVCVAQDQPVAPGGLWLAAQIAKKTLLDPTSYTPAALLYVSSRLDWDSSQAFFRNGSLEQNPRYTISGLPHDMPVSYSAGNRRILSDALHVLPISFANNAASVIALRMLAQHDPAHRRRWARLAWIERTAVAVSLSYALSVHHIQQWQQNDLRASQLGY